MSILTPFIPLSFEGEGEDIKRGAPPLLDTLVNPFDTPHIKFLLNTP